MKHLWMADGHISERIWVGRRNIEGDSDYAMSGVTGIANREAVDYIYYGGDTFDRTRPSAEELGIFKRHADLLNTVRGRWHIQGQHDMSGGHYSLCGAFGSSDLADCNNGDEMLSIGNISGGAANSECPSWVIYGLDFQTRDEFTNRLKAGMPHHTKASHVMMIHAPMKHLLGFEGAWKLEASDIPVWAGTTFVGDVHKLNVSRYNPDTKEMTDITDKPHRTDKDGSLVWDNVFRAADSPDKTQYIFSSSSIYPTSWSEVDKPHGVFIFDTEANYVKWCPVATRRFIKHSMDNITYLGVLAMLDELEEAEATSSMHASNGMYPVVLIERCDCGAVDPAKYPHLLMVDQPVKSLLANPTTFASTQQKFTLSSALPHLVDKTVEPDLFGFMEGLLASEDAQEYAFDWLRSRKVQIQER